MKAPTIKSAAIWILALTASSMNVNAFTYGVSLPPAPAGYFWQAAGSNFLWNTASQNIDLMSIDSGFIDADSSYNQSEMVLNQPFSISIPAFSVADLPDRFLLVTSQSIVTSIAYRATDVFTSASPILGSEFDVTRSGSVDFDASSTGGESFSNSISPSQNYQVSLVPLQARTQIYNLNASSSVSLTGANIDVGAIQVDGTVSSISHQLEASTTPTGLVIVGSDAQSARAELRNQLNYTQYNLVPIPEPSVALLGAFGLLALFRRQRIA